MNDKHESTWIDMVYINITESRFNCALKFLLWCAHCQSAFPTARFHMVADDDTFIQLAHLETDLLSVPATGHVMWGLAMWCAAPRPKGAGLLRPSPGPGRRTHVPPSPTGTPSTTM